MKYYVYSVILVVLVVIVAGFFVVGSPKEERIRQFDERRVQDLQFIQGEVLNFWLNKARLPKDLSEIRDDIRGVLAPKDPETGAEYSYQVKAPETFALCATFSLSNDRYQCTSKQCSRSAPVPPAPAGPYYTGEYGLNQNWDHGPGQVCFERKIDKELYKPNIKK